MNVQQVIFQTKAHFMRSKLDEWLYTLKNTLLILLMFCPIVTAILFNLSNLFYVFGMIIVSVGVVCSLFLRIGSNINLLFMANSIIIQDAKENMEIRKDEISLIKIHQHSGSRPAFVLEIYQISGCKKTILIDKFRFQNPRRKLGMLVELEEWKEVIEL